jgi:choline dehydrogenase-like flavoprotein
MPAEHASDVAVIGTGPAGARIARELAEYGRHVAMFELGPRRDLEDLVSSQIWARRLKWGGAPVLHDGADGFGFNLSAGAALGGAGLHHYACWPRLHESDFRMRSEYGRGVDWPIDYATLRPWYDAVQDEIGIAGDAGQEIWRPPGAPYPQQPLPLLAQGAAIRRGFSSLGLHTAPLPAAILTQPKPGRVACLYDGWCDAGCPVGALWNPLVSEIPRALAAGAILHTGAQVTRILTGRPEHAEAIEYVDGEGVVHRHRTGMVVVATGAIQSARLLLASANDDHPEGLSNRNGRLGSGFMAHGLALVYGLFHDETEPARGISCGQLISHDHYPKQRVQGGFGSVQWQIAPAAKPNDIFGVAISRADLFGQPLADFLRRAMQHFGSMAGLIEDLPRPDSRIELSQERDRAGMRLARVNRQPDADGAALRRRALHDGLEIFKAAGSSDSWSGPLAAGHILGGTPMGDDPSSSVTDSYGRLHELGNVFVAGSSIFPTGGAVNPTFTITALAARTSAYIKAH